MCVAAQETDCIGGMTHTEWCNPCLTSTDRLHPTAFKPDMVSQESMALMREVGAMHVFSHTSLISRTIASVHNSRSSRKASAALCQAMPAEGGMCVHRSA